MHKILYFLKKIFFHRYVIYLIDYCFTQNMITIAILPIYMSWGISFSTLLWIGNSLFLPFLVLYLILSVLLFFSFFFNCFSSFLLFTHNMVIDCWLYLLATFSFYIPYYQFCFVDIAPYSYFICWGLFCFLLFFLSKYFFSSYKKFFISSIAVLSLFIFFSFIKPTKNNFLIFDENKTYYVRLDTLTSMVYIGSLSKSRRPSRKKIEYLFIPYIRKYFGIFKPNIVYI